MSDFAKIGIDVGTSAIKLVELSPSGKDKWRLVAAGSIATPPGGLNGGTGNQTAVAQLIAKTIKEIGIKSRKAVVALPEEQISSHLVEMPLMKDEEIQQALKWQVEQYIPIPSDKAIWSYEVVKKTDTGMEILLVAAAKALVQNYTQVIEQAGLELVAIETELMAVARSLFVPNNPLMMVIDVGSAGSDLGVVANGQLMFSRTIPTGGLAFTRALETGLNLDTATAEQYKNTYGFAEDKLKGELVKAMKPVLAVIAGELRKTADFYSSKNPGQQVKLVVMSGGVSVLPEMVGMLSGMIGMEVVIGNPFARVELNNAQSKAMEGNMPFYTVATGLAMRPIE